jgi:hypothetical protein
MKPSDLFAPLFGKANRPPSRREYFLGGLLCSTLAAGAWAVDMGIGGVVAFGVLGAGCFVLSARKAAAVPAHAGGDA